MHYFYFLVTTYNLRFEYTLNIKFRYPNTRLLICIVELNMVYNSRKSSPGTNPENSNKIKYI